MPQPHSDRSEKGTRFVGALLALWQQATAWRKWQFGFAICASVVTGIIEMISVGAVIPFLAIAAGSSLGGRAAFIQSKIAAVAAATGFAPIVVAASFLAITAVVAAVARLTLAWQIQSFVYGVEYDLMLRVYDRILKQRYESFVQGNSSVSLAGLEKVMIVGQSILSPLMTALSSICMAVIIIALILYVDKSIALMTALSLCAVYVPLSLFVRKKMYAISVGEAGDRIARIRIAQETLGSMRDIILDKSEGVFLGRMEEIQEIARQMRISSSILQIAPRFIVESFGILLLAGLAVYMDGGPGGVTAALPVLGVLAVGAQRLMPMMQLVYIGWAACRIYEQHLVDVIDLGTLPLRPPVPPSSSGGVPAFKKIEMVGLRYRYPDRPDSWALAGIDLSIRSGEKVGVIGSTGSGKSTFVDVLMGLLEPTKGYVATDGVPLSHATINRWQSSVSHVPQSIYLSDTSIRDNIVFGADGPFSEGRIADAVRQAGLADFVASLPQGLDTHVGERGAKLSGGQRQRIGIARALYRDCRLLVLDEATSALDLQTEEDITRSIKLLDRDITIVMIAHRHASLRDCDRIIRLEGGKIAWEGSFEDLGTAA